MKNRSYIISFFIAVLLLVTGCKTKEKPMKDRTKFSYMTTVNAPNKYPVEVHFGIYTDSLKKQIIAGIPRSGLEFCGWDCNGTAAGMGGEEMPEYLDLTYVAYAEKKFYRVQGHLPVEKMLALFREGYYYYNNKEKKFIYGTYDTITVNIAPGGMVVVFVSGYSRKEVCRLKAKEVFVDVNDFYDNADEDSQEEFFNAFYDIHVEDYAKEEIARDGIEYGLYELYRKKFSYRFVFDSYLDDDKFTTIYSTFFNGESNVRFGKTLEKNDYEESALPYNCSYYFTRFNTEIHFNHKELLTVFRNFNKKYPNKALDIIVRPKFNYDEFEILVSVPGTGIEVALKDFEQKGVWTNSQYLEKQKRLKEERLKKKNNEK